MKADPPDSPAMAKLRYQLRRGMLELDAILSRFFSEHYASLNRQDQQSFAKLLEESDPQLYRWLIGMEEPERAEFAALIQRIRKHSRGS